MESADTPPTRSARRSTPWIAVFLALGMSGYLVWSSNGPKVALLDWFGETAQAEIVSKDEVHSLGASRSWSLQIGYETTEGEARQFVFEAPHYPRVMETGSFAVRYLPSMPSVAWPVPAMHWSVTMLVIGVVPGVLAVLLALVAWYEGAGRRRPWARRLDAGMESAWERLSDRMQA